jgi:hypothetical protein
VGVEKLGGVNGPISRAVRAWQERELRRLERDRLVEARRRELRDARIADLESEVAYLRGQLDDHPPPARSVHPVPRPPAHPPGPDAGDRADPAPQLRTGSTRRSVTSPGMGSRVAPVLRDPVTLIVGGLAVHRLTRLVTEDEITDPSGTGSATRAPEGRLAYLVRCRWCVSPYVAAGWALLAVTAPSVAAPVGAALAWSSVTGLLASVE